MIEHVALDIMEPMNEMEHRNKCVLVTKDYFTKWVEAFPLLTRPDCAMFVVPHNNTPTLQLTLQPVSKAKTSSWKCVYVLFGIEKTHNITFRTQSDGQVEPDFHSLAMPDFHRFWPQQQRAATATILSWHTGRTGTVQVVSPPNFMLFAKEGSEPVDLVAGLPLDPEGKSSSLPGAPGAFDPICQVWGVGGSLMSVSGQLRKVKVKECTVLRDCFCRLVMLFSFAVKGKVGCYSLTFKKKQKTQQQKKKPGGSKPFSC